MKSIRINETSKSIVTLALIIGLLTGFVEAILLYVLQQRELLSGNIIFLGSGPRIFWLSPLSCLLLFGVIGFLFAIVAHFIQNKLVYQSALFVFLWMMIFDWVYIPLSGRISIYAVLLLAAGVALQLSRLAYRRHETINRLSRKALPVISALLIASFILVEGGQLVFELIVTRNLPATSADNPNILVIVVDTLRADHLSSYGYSRQTSPTIDQLAQKGALFENAISPASWTQPAHASILTGLFPHEHGADDARLDSRYPTITEEMKSSGYRTAAFSANYEVFNRIDGFGQGFIHFEDYYQSLRNLAVNSLYGRIFEYYVLHQLLGMPYRFDRRLADQINRSVLDWVDQEGDNPFFVFINYFDVHAPYIPPQPYRSMFSDKPAPGGKINADWGMDQIYTGLNENEIQDEVDAYDGAIAYVDDQIKQLITELDRRGFLENTAIVILSDHGESFGEHNLLEHHNSLYKEIIRVPLMIIWPGHIPENLRIDTPVSLVSLTATIQDIAGVADQNLFSYPSLTSLWTEQADQTDWPAPMSEEAQVQWVPPQHLTYDGAIKSIYSSDAHYIDHEKFGEELYDWHTDPQEIDNLAEVPEWQSAIENHRKSLDEIFGGTR